MDSSETAQLSRNAQRHRNRRWVFNIDLRDFFPTINFGRIRGFLMKNRDFALNPRVATAIAQIACFDDSLPQGSPSSPVLANLIAHILDMRLLRLVREVGCTYTRYADDLTFSTNKRLFPPEIAALSPAGDANPHIWLPGEQLRGIVERSGFFIHDEKTHMMYKHSRQEVTGLVINEEMRPRPEYRRLVRAMVHRLVTTGGFEILRAVEKNGVTTLEKRPGNPDELHGMLGFVDFVRYCSNKRLGKTPEDLSAEEKAYRDFLMYRLFYAAIRPTILCEGETDNVYLTHAIRSLAPKFQDLATIEANGKIRLLVRLFRYPRSSTTRLLRFYDGGSGVLKNFIVSYKRATDHFRGPGLQNPIITLFDNDDGGKPVRAAISSITKQNLLDQFSFVHVSKNLYAVTTPGRPSTIEDCFDDQTKAIRVAGKSFNPSNQIDDTLHYGKKVFAYEVVAKHADTIDFKGFEPLLENLAAAIRKHRESIVTDAAAPISGP
jgi:RNA-directed DNA polymerase